MFLAANRHHSLDVAQGVRQPHVAADQTCSGVLSHSNLQLSVQSNSLNL
jgi:hypothetical protein